MARLPFLIPAIATIKLLSCTAAFSILMCIVLGELEFLRSNLHILYALVIAFSGTLGVNYYFYRKNVLYL
jgi:hypothetical protein